MDQMTEFLPVPIEEPSKQIKLKVPRTSTSKVRTGCITCKKRHVKCDEAKPHCGNCVRNKRQCEGYGVLDKKRNASGPLQIRWDSKQIARPASPTAQLHLVHDSLDFRDAKSVLYFDEFVQVVQGPWISAGFNSDLWAVALPQIARTNSIVRHAAIGIGALSKWYNKSQHKSLGALQPPQGTTIQEDADYLQALAHYCLALKLQSQHASIQDAVFLSVLFLCFETLRGNRKAALDHINHGLAMLLALLTDPESRLMASLAPNPKPLVAVVADIFTNLLPQTRLILRGSIGLSPAVPNFTRGLRDKKQTVESFMTMIGQLPRSSPASGKMPPVFDSLDDFEKYWIIGRTEKLSMNPLLVDIVQETGVLTSDDPSNVAHMWQSVTADPRVREICEASDRDLQALETAFMPVYNKAIMSDPASPDYMRAIHLRLHYLSTYAFNNLTQFFNAEPIHAKTPLFREYLSLAQISLQTAKRGLKNPAQQLSLQCNLALHLLLASFFCRDPLLRDEAIWMLKDYPGQDGIFNARSLYVLARRNRAVEQANVSEGTLEEQWHRLLRREYLFEEGGDRIIFCYLEKDAASGNWQLVEETAEIRGDLEAIQWQRRPLTASGRPLMGDVIKLWPELVN
ncbi:hypothetical protein FSARC_2630 [Fusarium sarcochroum]|uniref:Zn(2)-C6 fungal-type domain-containing protein n=1 Tax=Fusarium sarcochroum TaxID=1208366 RepID=A0A8H4XDF3_9HYPO|nr:hypothetical protein FSARC_2630 [Fusarium sarcochroum]